MSRYFLKKITVYLYSILKNDSKHLLSLQVALVLNKLVIVIFLNQLISYFSRCKINLMTDKKEKNIPKGVLVSLVDKRLSTAMTVKDIRILMEIKGIADNYTWKENSLGHLTAWEKR